MRRTPRTSRKMKKRSLIVLAFIPSEDSNDPVTRAYVPVYADTLTLTRSRDS